MSEWPDVGEIVIYTSRAGPRGTTDMPAIVTARGRDTGWLHLTVFPPPGEAPDVLDRTWGVPHTPYEHQGAAGTWRARS